jgi:hypothetical protein
MLEGFQGIVPASTYVSFDGGISWNLQIQQVLSGLPSFQAVQYGDGKFVAVGDRGAIGTSTNGIAWELKNAGTDSDLRGVAYGRNEFVAVGPGTVMTSPDGLAWSLQDAGVALVGITYGNGLFVAVGAAGAIVTSEDGKSWIRRDSGTSAPLYGAAYGGGNYVAVGTAIVSSKDGVHWVSRPNPSTSFLRGVAYGGRSFVAVGEGGTVVQSGSLVPRLIGQHRTGQAGFEILLNGWVETGSRVQATTAFGSWEDLLVFTNSQSDASFLDSATNHSHQFYRLALP